MTRAAVLLVGALWWAQPVLAAENFPTGSPTALPNTTPTPATSSHVTVLELDTLAGDLKVPDTDDETPKYSHALCPNGHAAACRCAVYFKSYGGTGATSQLCYQCADGVSHCFTPP